MLYENENGSSQKDFFLNRPKTAIKIASKWGQRGILWQLTT